jgi:hypothetical protein
VGTVVGAIRGFLEGGVACEVKDGVVEWGGGGVKEGVFACGLVKEGGEPVRRWYDAVRVNVGEGEGMLGLYEDCGEASGRHEVHGAW